MYDGGNGLGGTKVFGKNGKEAPDTSGEIPVLTVDYFPGKDVEPIGTIFVNFGEGKLLKFPDWKKVIPEMQREAHKFSADAVLGFRFNLISSAVMVAYGTAVRFL